MTFLITDKDVFRIASTLKDQSTDNAAEIVKTLFENFDDTSVEREDLVSVLSYKGFRGSIEGVDIESNLIYGRILYTSDLIDFYGKTAEDLKKNFEIAVDDYIDMLIHRYLSNERRE